LLRDNYILLPSHRLSVFGSEVLKRIFGPNGEERESEENYVLRIFMTCTFSFVYAIVKGICTNTYEIVWRRDTRTVIHKFLQHSGPKISNEETLRKIQT
jgi:hypothetical protein